MNKVMRIISVGLLALMLLLTMAIPAFAAPDLPENVSCVAHCATHMGGQHVAQCAQMMEKGVSACATMSYSDCVHSCQ